MARVTDIIEGLRIMLRYSPPEVQLGGADHDILYDPPINPDKIAPDDRVRLEELGWHRDSDGYYNHFV